jgi:hypothetical protein
VVLTCLFLCLSFTAVAYADPITITQDFKPLTAVATISGGAILVSTVGVEAFVVQNANWTLSVDIKLVNDANLGDMISIDGTMRHLNNLPDDGQHQNAAEFKFSITIKPGDNEFPPKVFTGNHLPHLDRDTVTADIKRTGNQIDSWKIEIKGEHIATPEPTSMFLLGTGLAGVALKVRKRFKNRKSG